MTTLLFRDDVALVLSEFDAALDKYREVLETNRLSHKREEPGKN